MSGLPRNGGQWGMTDIACRALRPPAVRPSREVVPQLQAARRVMDDDPVDNKPQIEESCRPQCSKLWSEYEACIGRVKGDTSGDAHCTGQYLDFWKCIDKCAVPKVFATLK